MRRRSEGGGIPYVLYRSNINTLDTAFLAWLDTLSLVVFFVVLCVKRVYIGGDYEWLFQGRL